MSERRNGREAGGPEEARVEALGVLVLLGIALFFVFFGSLILMGVAAAAGWSALGLAADVGLLLALVLGAGLVLGTVAWFGVTVARLGRDALRRRG
ncbi:MAG TPA: hypothetical protein VIO14_04235 [Dehalococcoidia bacterium]